MSTEKVNRSTGRTGYPSIDKLHYKGTTFFERHPLIPDISISNAIDVQNYFRQDAYVFDCLDLRVTHRQFKEDARVISRALLQMGVTSGDIVTVSMPNYYQAVAVFKAANRIGAITTFLNPFAADDELKHYINQYQSPVLFHFGKAEDYSKTLLQNTCLKYVVTLRREDVCKAGFQSDASDTTQLSYRELGGVAARYKGREKTLWGGGVQEALILYTSGSTGEPKSLLFTNGNILSALTYLKNSTHLPKPGTDKNRYMGVVPMMYPYGFVCSILASIFNGCEVVMAPDINPDNIAYYYGKKPNLVFGSPAFLEVTKRNLPNDFDCSTLTQFVSGGDYLSESQSRDGVEFFHKHHADVAICNGSGNGELLGCCTNSMNVPYRPDTVGQLVLGPEYVIVDTETGEEVKYGEPGVLLVRGKHVFKGYYGREDLTKEVMVQHKGKQYYKTGNIGYLDEDRFFHMIGRSSRFFIVYTLNKVYCELVQNVVASIDAVDSCAVVPQPDHDMLFVSKAYVVLKSGYEPNEETEQHILEESRKPYIDGNGQEIVLKEYETPKSVTFLNELPRTAADKIDYEGMKKMTEEELQSE